MGDLTRNFSVREFACHCGCLKGGPSPDLVDALQRLRDNVGRAVFVNSGFRCAQHNASVGGSPNSQHLLGRAADVRIDGMTPAEMARWAETVPAFANGGIGTYPTFIHVDVRGYVARWNGK